MKLRDILAVLAVIVLILAGCAKTETTTATTASPIHSTESTEEHAVSSLLESVELTLPDSIIRQNVSGTRAYFYQNEEVIGGIELLDIASQMDTVNLQAYVDQALAVIQDVYNAEYDYMAESGDYCRAIVSVSSQDGREFYHYFFNGTQMGYDVWMDNGILDTREMRSYLKTLHSEDLYNPQDDITINEETPILNLVATMPDGITRQPTMITRELFYCGEKLAGGIEQIDTSKDLDALSLTAVNLAQELYGEEFAYTSEEDGSDEEIVAVIFTDSEDTHLVHYIRNVGAECYDVWTDTTVISVEDALAIAQSCQY